MCRAGPGSRIIPAYAGSTNTGPTAAPTPRDHPRIRGEHIQKQSADSTGKGSSPHTRGAHHGVRADDRGRDHPRIRGEHQRPQILHERLGGSSPHTRGAPEDPRHRDGVDRIIPAYAGSTVWPMAGWNANADHPRIRGEHPCRSLGRSSSWGSSPHTRGARHKWGSFL